MGQLRHCLHEYVFVNCDFGLKTTNKHLYINDDFTKLGGFLDKVHVQQHVSYAKDRKGVLLDRR